jgi:hypothetical protein
MDPYGACDISELSVTCAVCCVRLHLLLVGFATGAPHDTARVKFLWAKTA